jgi:hypothetical protein
MKGVFDKGFEISEKNSEKPALSTYTALRRGLSLKYRDFLKISRDESVLALLMNYCYLGYDMSYFRENENPERIVLIVKAMLDGRIESVPSSVLEIEDMGTFREAINILSAGIKPSAYSFKGYSQQFLTELRKRLTYGEYKNIDINSFKTLDELYRNLSSENEDKQEDKIEIDNDDLIFV